MKNYDYVVVNCRFHAYDKNKLVFEGGFRDKEATNAKIVACLDDEEVATAFEINKGVEVCRKYLAFGEKIYEEAIGIVDLPEGWKQKKYFQVKYVTRADGIDHVTEVYKVYTKDLVKLQEKVPHFIEGVEFEGDTLKVKGWMIGSDESSITLYDGNTQVPCEIARFKRDDLVHSFFELEPNEEYGFSITATGMKGSRYRIVLKTKDRQTECPLKKSGGRPIVTTVYEGLRHLKRYGAKKTVKKVLYKVTGNERFKDMQSDVDYEDWITQVEDCYTYDETFAYNPKISIVVPVYNTLDMHLVPCIESVMNQIYENWELCLADDNSTWENVGKTLAEYEDHEKVKVVYRKENGHISKCTNSAIEVATGEFIAFMDCDDVLRPNALYEVVKVLNENPDLDFIYSDEDKIDDDGQHRHMPHFKPDWSPDTLMSHMYTSHLGVYRASLVKEIGGLRPGFEGAQDYDFTLRFTEKTDRIAHISKVLYHWRERKESTAINPGAKPYILEAAKKSKAEAVERRGLKAELELIDVMYQYRVNYVSQTNPLVSIIIPSKDNYDILERCVKTLTELTEYKNYEIVLVDNGSNDENYAKYLQLSKDYSFEYVYEKMDFNFSRMCNIGAQKAKGEYFLFLNDDIEIIEKEWLSRMVGHAELSHIGAVGAKLMYPGNGKIQHVGVIEIENGPVHAFTGYRDEIFYYFGRNKLDYNWLAVTAACLLVSKEKYHQVGGFDEDLVVAYNDVDFCFKLVEAGYYNVVRNDVVLLHHESVSRGNDLIDDAKMIRLMKEQKKLYDKHPRFNQKDPFYSVNLTQKDVNFDYNMR